MDKWKDDALSKHEHDLKVNLHLISILSCLEQPAGGFMSKAERQHVEAAQGEFNQVDRIIKVLRGKGNKEFDIFLEVLRNNGHKVWADKVEESGHLIRQVE